MRSSDRSTKSAGRAPKNRRQGTRTIRATAKQGVLGEREAGIESVGQEATPAPPQALYDGGPWGNRDDLPRRPLPDFLRKDAEALRGIRRLDFRLARLVLLIGQARLNGWIGLEDQIVESAGLAPAEFWRAYIPRQCTPESYAFALARMMSDPTEQDIVGTVLPIVPENEAPRHDSIAPVSWQLRRALRRAYDADEPWFVRLRPVGQVLTIQEAPNPQRPRPRPAVEVLTDDAGRYIAADPRTRELLPPSYLAFLGAGGHAQPYPTGSAAERPAIGEQKPPASSAVNISEAKADAADGDEPPRDNPLAAMRRTRDALMRERKIVLPMETAEQHRLVLKKLGLDPNKKPPRGYGYETFRGKVAVDG